MRLSFSSGAAALAAILPCAAFAVTATEPIIVTATRTARTVDETMAPVTVITAEDIERSQARSVQDLLRGSPGVALTNAGGPGKATSVFLRGTESDHVLVLIDGVKVGSATLGTTPFQDLPVSEIDRIEVVRGPRSHLYGSEAIGGVIQIFTRRGGGELAPRFSVGGGSYATRNGSLGISGGGDDAWYNISASSARSDGFNACNGEPLLAGCFTVEPDKDGYDNDSASVRAGFRLARGGEVDVHYLRSDNATQFDGEFQNETETTEEVYGIGLKLNAGADTLFRVDVGRSRDLSDNFKNSVFASRFDTERDSASVQVDRDVGERHTLTGGIDYLNDRVDSDLAFTRDSRDNVGLFVQYLGGFDAADVQLGLRRDDNAQFGGKTTGGLTLGRRLASGTRVTLALGTAFKAPSFNDLYFPGFGNPDLAPEESQSVEFGIAGRGWSVNVYRTAIDDLIGSDPDTFAPVNIDSARITGLELVYDGQLAGWDFGAALTLLDAENRSTGFTGNVLPRRAGESLRLDLDRDFGRFSAGATLIAEGRKFDDLANARTIDSYTTFDLRASTYVGSTFRLEFRVENVFDADYETASYFNQSGRAWYLTLRYTGRR